MENVVDSKQEPLPAPTILTMVVKQLDLGDTPEATLLGLAKEISMPNVDQTQVGNTVFLGHRGKGANKNKMFGRAFNVDTARNYTDNFVKYLKVLQQKRITHYSVDIKGETLVPMVKAVGKKLRGTGTQARMFPFEGGSGYRLFFKLPENSEAR